MKTAVCFGDSLTWCLNPQTGSRHERKNRWTEVMRLALRERYDVIAEGLVNRTTNLDDPVCPDRNGWAQLSACLDSHKPIDVLVLMLGTNDLKSRFSRSPTDIAESAARLASAAKANLLASNPSPSRVILVAPPPVLELGDYLEMYAGATVKSRDLSVLYRRYARWAGVEFFDAGSVVNVSSEDGIHLDSAANHRLGAALANVVQNGERP